MGSPLAASSTGGGLYMWGSNQHGQLARRGGDAASPVRSQGAGDWDGLRFVELALGGVRARAPVIANGRFRSVSFHFSGAAEARAPAFTCVPGGALPCEDVRIEVQQVELLPALRVGESSVSGEVGRVRAELRVLKPLPEALWLQVERSYRNLLNDEGLAAARARSA